MIARLGRPTAKSMAARCSTTPSTSSTASAPTPSTPRDAAGRATPAGAHWLILCDTNGGTLPERDRRRSCARCAGTCARRSASTSTTTASWPWPTPWPRSPTGATQVQGTINGIGERCGNVDLVSVIANLALKLGHDVLRPEPSARADGAVALRLRDGEHELPSAASPSSGDSAFAHKGGMHVARSPSTRRPTSTSTPRRSATTAACWCPSWQGARTSLEGAGVRDRHRAGHAGLSSHP